MDPGERPRRSGKGSVRLRGHRGRLETACCLLRRNPVGAPAEEGINRDSLLPSLHSPCILLSTPLPHVKFTNERMMISVGKTPKVFLDV